MSAAENGQNQTIYIFVIDLQSSYLNICFSKWEVLSKVAVDQWFRPETNIPVAWVFMKNDDVNW